MNERLIINGIPALTAAVGFAFIAWWLGVEPRIDLSRRDAETNARTRSSVGGSRPFSTAREVIDLSGTFQLFDGKPSSLPGRWPRFRGEVSTNIVKSPGILAESWPENGPPILWKVSLGEGYAGPAVLDGKVYLLDYDEAAGADSLRCFSLDDGQEIWSRSYRVKIKRNHGMSRTLPAVTEKYAVTVGPKCQVMCVASNSGRFLWGIDLAAEYGTKVPLWYTGQCPLIDDETAIIAPGGKAIVIGVDCASGRVVFETPNPHGWEMSHASVIPMTLGGRRVYVYCAIGGIVGVAADGPERGSVLWETNAWNLAVVAPSPVYAGDDRFFVTAGYGAGGKMFRVLKTEVGFEAREVFTTDKSVFACEQHTPIFTDGCLFTILPKDAGEHNRELACMTPEGKVLWTSGKTERFGSSLGPYIMAGNKIFILADDGTLTLAEVSASGYRRLSRAHVLKGREAWAPMALVSGRLLLRDSRTLVCLDVSGANSSD